MTADPAAVIAAALDRQFREKHGPRGQIDDIIRAAHADIGKAAVAALQAAGWAVVRVEETREEWGVAHWAGDGKPSLVAGYDDAADAAEHVEWYAPGSSVVHRTAHFGPWEPAG